jgi:hypothetical protein
MQALKKITTEAKKIRKQHPKMAWKSAVEMASKRYRSGKISGVKKKKKPTRRYGRGQICKGAGGKTATATAKSKRVGGMVGTIAQHKTAAIKLIAEKLGWLDVMLLSAKKVAAKNKLLKRRAQYMKEARALS